MRKLPNVDAGAEHAGREFQVDAVNNCHTENLRLVVTVTEPIRSTTCLPTMPNKPAWLRSTGTPASYTLPTPRACEYGGDSEG